MLNLNKLSIFIIILLLYCHSLLVADVSIDSLMDKLNISNNKDKVDILNQLANTKSNTEPNDKYFYAQQALDLARKISYIGGEIDAYINIGDYYTRKAFYENSLSNLNKALSKVSEIDDPKRKATIYKNIGNVYYYYGEYDKALSYYINTLNIAEEIRDSSLIAYSYHNFSIIYTGLDQTEKALDYSLKALQIKQKLGDKNDIANTNLLIGSIYMELKFYNTAIGYLNTALELSTEMNNKSMIAYSLNNIGHANLKLSGSEGVLDYYLEALELLRSIDDFRGISTTMSNIGDYYTTIKNYDKAEEYYLKALDLSKKMNAKDIEKENYDLLYQFYQKIGDFEKALEYHVKYSDTKDEIFANENQKRVEKLQAEFGFERKEKEIQLLKQESDIKNLLLSKQKHYKNIFLILILFLAIVGIQSYYRYYQKKKAHELLIIKNKEIERQKQQVEKMNDVLHKLNEDLIESEEHLKELNMTKDKFFSIIAHDLKNPTQAFIGIADIMSENLEKLTEFEVRKFIHLINRSAVHLGELLENLLEWAQSQSGRIKFSPASYDLYNIVKDTVSHMNFTANSKGIALINDVKEGTEVLVDKHMISTVLRNLISNALKFTKEEGQVRVYSVQKEKEVIVTVEDTGTGITKENLNKLFRLDVKFTSKGTKNEKGTGLGLILCQEFIQKNGGKIWVESIIDVGSKFKFSVPRKVDNKNT